MRAHSFRFALLCGVLLLSAHTAVCGKYLRTLDKKAHIWNDDPKPGDEAHWSGKRDEQDFATGTGTLTWYHAEQGPSTRTTFYQEKLHIVSNLTGTMVRGRWEGMVEAIDTNGRISHARFDNGKLIEPWSEGHAPDVVQPPPVAATAKPKTEPPKSTPPPERWNEPAALPEAKPANSPRLAPTPVPKKQTAPIVEAPHSVQTETPRLQMEAPRLPRRDEGPTISAKTAFDAPVFDTPVATAPAPAPAPAPPGRTRSDSTAGSSLLSQPALSSQSGNLGGDDLLHSLAAPPALLKHRASLSPREAAKIAEVELAKEGYILTDYPRRQIAYDSDNDMWVFSYAHDPASTSAAGPPQFGVTVEDKTAKAALRAIH